jgi:methyl-accepting chemotaxis protein
MVIARMDVVSAAIASAVQQQTATTRELASGVQAISGATDQTARSMREVAGLADNAGSVSREVRDATDTIGHETERLRSGIAGFLLPVRDDTVERRSFERVRTRATVSLRVPGRQPTRATLTDMSRGGASLICDQPLTEGAEVEIELPKAGGHIPARVIRAGGGELAVVFKRHPEDMARIDRALDAITDANLAA